MTWLVYAFGSAIAAGTEAHLRAREAAVAAALLVGDPAAWASVRRVLVARAAAQAWAPAVVVVVAGAVVDGEVGDL